MVSPDYQKKYYADNKEKYKEYFSTKVFCPECRAEYCRSNQTNHLKSKKHIKALETQKNEYKKVMAEYKKLEKRVRQLEKLIDG